MTYLKKVEYYKVEDNKIYETVRNLILYTDLLRQLVSFCSIVDSTTIQFDSKISTYIDKMIEDIVFSTEYFKLYYKSDYSFTLEELITVQNLCREMIQNDVETCQIDYIGTVS